MHEPEGCRPEGECIHIRQITCYNCYVTRHNVLLCSVVFCSVVTGELSEECEREVSQTIVSPSLINLLNIIERKISHGWCPCNDCASFSPDAGGIKIQCNKSLKRKKIEGCEVVKNLIQQECNNNQTTSDGMYKPEIEAEKKILTIVFHLIQPLMNYIETGGR